MLLLLLPPHTQHRSLALKTRRWLGKIKGRDTAIHPCGRLRAESRAALLATHEHCEAALLSCIKKAFPAARKETLGTVPCAAAPEQQPEQSPLRLREREMLGAAGDAGSVRICAGTVVSQRRCPVVELFVPSGGDNCTELAMKGRTEPAPELAGRERK